METEPVTKNHFINRPGRATQYAVAVAALFVVIMLAIAGSYGLSLWAINRSQHQWCDTLTLLTSNGPPKPGSPNYDRAESFYLHLLKLRSDFRC